MESFELAQGRQMRDALGGDPGVGRIEIESFDARQVASWWNVSSLTPSQAEIWIHWSFGSSTSFPIPDGEIPMPSKVKYFRPFSCAIK